MGYIPTDFRTHDLGEIPINALTVQSQPAVVRRLRLIGGNVKRSARAMIFEVEGVARRLTVEEDRPMRFGHEEVQARAYFQRVIERGDLLDVITAANSPDSTEPLALQIFWIHIRYEGQPSQAPRWFRQKDDGLFAMRAKAGEKAERRVARLLQEQHGHLFPPDRLESPGEFVIRYANKGMRLLDLNCTRCQLKLEIKRQNSDRRFRVSHSTRRPFAADNPPSGWHAFVFPDLEPRFVRNALILDALAAGSFTPGRDGDDEWADIEAQALEIEPPPMCPLVVP